MTESDLRASLAALSGLVLEARDASDRLGSADDGTSRTEREALLDEATEYLNDWRRWCEQLRTAEYYLGERLP
jgi:hypothetical protein